MFYMLLHHSYWLYYILWSATLLNVIFNFSTTNHYTYSSWMWKACEPYLPPFSNLVSHVISHQQKKVPYHMFSYYLSLNVDPILLPITQRYITIACQLKFPLVPQRQNIYMPIIFPCLIFIFKNKFDLLFTFMAHSEKFCIKVFILFVPKKVVKLLWYFLTANC